MGRGIEVLELVIVTLQVPLFDSVDGDVAPEDVWLALNRKMYAAVSPLGKGVNKNFIKDVEVIF
jgi:hypothetical protein